MTRLWGCTLRQTPQLMLCCATRNDQAAKQETGLVACMFPLSCTNFSITWMNIESTTARTDTVFSNHSSSLPCWQVLVVGRVQGLTLYRVRDPAIVRCVNDTELVPRGSCSYCLSVPMPCIGHRSKDRRRSGNMTEVV